MWPGIIDDPELSSSLYAIIQKWKTYHPPKCMTLIPILYVEVLLIVCETFEINPTKNEETMFNSQNPTKSIKMYVFNTKTGHTQHLKHTMWRRVFDEQVSKL